MDNEKDFILDFSKSLYNINDVKIFFGEYDGIQRYDRYKYQISENLVKAQRAATWFPTEISFTRDRAGFKAALSESFQEIYSDNLLFQTMADSLANRFLDNLLSDHITSPEWEAIIKWQAHFELVHSESYSWNIREVFGDPEAFFNNGFKNKFIQKRLDIELKSYSTLTRRLKEASSLDEKKIVIIDVLSRQYALENIRFFVSFLYTFKINEMNGQVLQGSINNIKFIANDELIHTIIFANLINILRTVENEGFSHLFTEDVKDMIIRNFMEVVESEVEWFEYLSSKQEISGFTVEEIRKFLMHFVDSAMINIGLMKKGTGTKANELVDFFNSKKDLRLAKAMAQETNLLTYNIGVLEDGGFEKENLDVDALYILGISYNDDSKK